jgi:hypothetical protein
LKSEAAELKEWILSHIDSLLTFALGPQSTSSATQMQTDLATMATRALSGPLGTLQSRLAECPVILQKLKEFISRDYHPDDCPTLFGHFESIFMAVLRRRDPATRKFESADKSAILTGLVARAHFPGVQSVLSQLLADYRSTFSLCEAIGLIATALSDLVDALNSGRSDKHVRQQRIGLFSVLISAFGEECSTVEGVNDVRWDEVILVLVDSTFELVDYDDDQTFPKMRDPDNQGLLRLGVQAVSSVIACLEKENVMKDFPAVPAYINAFSKRAYPESAKDVDELLQRPTQEAGNRVQLMIDSFPVLWPAGINVMLSVFFADPPFGPWLDKKRLWTATGEFRRAMLHRLTAMASANDSEFDEFMRWIDGNKVIARFKRAKRIAPSENRMIEDVPINPDVWELARLIIEKNQINVDGESRIAPPVGEDQLWDEVTAIIVENGHATDAVTAVS